MIFNEFHNSPPMCVCVQMCAGQSTYCYPNGCLRRDDRKREADQPVSLIENAQSSIFLVDQKNEVTRDLYGSGYYDNTATELGTKIEAVAEKQVNIRPDPFKDKYKSLFKYKKMPKVELRYNLREQVKNTKSDVLKSGSVDVSKTRWPQTKHNKLNGYTMLHDIREIHPSSAKQKKFFISSLPEKDLVTYPIRYFKRDLTKIDEKLNVTVNLNKEVFTNSTFSLETLIDNMIENFLTNNTVAKLDESNKTTSIEMSTEYFNETNIVLINSTNENFENSKYTEAINYTKVFNELIAKLSKKIERRNNTSMEIMQKFTNNVIIKDEISNEIDEKEVIKVETTTFEPTTKAKITVATTTPLNSLTDALNTTEQTQLSNTIPNDYNELKTMKKGRQRFARKLLSKKTN
ncbi:hypothetical protein O3G_MSEX002602 [Manduca sexta]|nr:hypothetical protein O3G_MSEX002602 [Manduca sexta]